MSNDYEIAEFAPLEDRLDLPDDINEMPSWIHSEMQWLAIQGIQLLEIEKHLRDTSA